MEAHLDQAATEQHQEIVSYQGDDEQATSTIDHFSGGNVTSGRKALFDETQGVSSLWELSRLLTTFCFFLHEIFKPALGSTRKCECHLLYSDIRFPPQLYSAQLPETMDTRALLANMEHCIPPKEEGKRTNAGIFCFQQ